MAVFIVRRETRAGEARFHVRVQTRRGQPQVHLGAFRQRKLAEARKAWAERELAEGRWPDVRAIEPDEVWSLRALVDSFLASRVDLSPASLRAYRGRLSVAVERVGAGADPRRIRRDDVQAWIVDEAAAGRSARYVGALVVALGQVFDHAGVRPNPARDVRKPRVARRRIDLPTRAELELLYARLAPHHADALRFIEHTGARINEVVELRWRDVDAARGRVLLDSKSPAGRRWVELPAGWDRLEPDGAARVFPGVSARRVADAMKQARDELGLRRVTPHTLRHLYASRALHEGKHSPAELAQRLGHSSPAITLGTYSHVVPPD
jgi:integrase